MSGDLSDEEDIFEMTEDGRFDDETAEPEVIIRLPRGRDPTPELVPRAKPMDPGQHRRVHERCQTETVHVRNADLANPGA